MISTKVALIWSVVLLLSLCLSCSAQPNTKLLIVIPDGFRGVVSIVEDAKSGSTVPPPTAANSYSSEIVIPDSGILKVRSIAPWTKWHTEEAQFADGSRLGVYGFDSVEDEEVLLRPIGMQKNNGHVEYGYFVGTLEDIQENQRNIGQ